MCDNASQTPAPAGAQRGPCAGALARRAIRDVLPKLQAAREQSDLTAAELRAVIGEVAGRLETLSPL